MWWAEEHGWQLSRDDTGNIRWMLYYCTDYYNKNRYVLLHTTLRLPGLQFLFTTCIIKAFLCYHHIILKQFSRIWTNKPKISFMHLNKEGTKGTYLWVQKLELNSRSRSWVTSNQVAKFTQNVSTNFHHILMTCWGLQCLKKYHYFEICITLCS